MICLHPRAELSLSFAQQRLWEIDQIEPGSPVYNLTRAVRLTGELSPALLARVFSEVVRRHEALRTTFVLCDGRPVQVVAPAAMVALPVIDLTDLPDQSDRSDQARRIALAEALRSFDLQRGPLLRLGLVRLAELEWLLLVSLHQIVSDGGSMGVLLREVAALYEAFSQGRPSPLPDLPSQYADFAIWQRSWLQGEILETQLAWWKSELAGAPQMLELPTDRSSPPRKSFRGAAQPVALPTALSDAVRKLGRETETTPFMVLLAAWSVLLGRHAGQDDVLVGSELAGRNRRETEGLIGPFASTLVLRMRLGPETGAASLSFRELLGRARRTVLDAFEHRDLLAEELAPFQAMLVLEEDHEEGWRLPGLTIEPVPLASQTSRLHVLLALAESRDGGIAGSLEYSTDLFDEDRMVRLLQGFEVLLAGAVAEPERPFMELPLLTAAERNRLLVEWNDNAVPYPHAAVHEPVEEQAERTPDALAAVWAGAGGAEAALTYRELDRRANRLAHHLRALGAGPDERVSICLERSLDLLVAVLGVLKAGGAYVPIDPDYPAERVAFMLADSRSRVLVTTSEVASRLPDFPRRVLLDADREAIAARSGVRPAGRTTAAEQLAYVVYTSGSTGRPKGVAMPHGVLANLLMWQRGASAAGPGSRTLQFASLSFDVSFQEIFSTWWTGGTVVALPQETRRDALALCQVLHGQRVARLFLPFVALQQIAEVIEHGAPLPAELTEIVTAGEQLQITRQIAGWLERMEPSGAFLENQYGPSEGHVVSAHRLTGTPGRWPALPPIGRPLPNVRMYLLDRSFEPVPQGVPGHLCFGGAQVVRGYLDRPELTAEKFVPDPYSREPGARLYATGDQARYLAGGEIVYVGRIDQQVKIRGFRVEPGEVETALTRHPAVSEAAVVVHGDGSSRRLVGYYVSGESLQSGELRAFLAAELPEHMMPAVLVRLDALPLTPSGKLDRRALPAPQSSGADGEAYTAPSDPVQELLAGIWAKVLGRDRVGIHDGFFSLGGHSLLATRVASRIRQAFGVEIPLRRLFEGPTVAELARVVGDARRRDGTEAAQAPLVRLPRGGAQGEPPLSFAQQRLWVIDQLDPGSPAYNIPWALRWTGPLSAGLLARVFAEVVRRHEALRTTFVEGRDGRPVQVIAPPASPELPVVDLSGLPAAEREARAIASAEALRPFDLERGPLLRLCLLRLGARDYVLSILLHHVVSDEWSMGVLLREVGLLYAAFAAGRPSPLAELPVQYSDFAVWQRGWLQGEVLERQLAWWTRDLAGAPQVLELPVDRPRPVVQTFRGAARPVTLPPALSEAVRTLCLETGSTPFMVLLAAWAILLGRHAGQDDVLLGSPIAGRNRREIEELIGFFVNTLVLRSAWDQETTFRQLLARVRSTALDAFEHQDLPVERLVEELVSDRDLSRTPLFQALFAMQNAPGQSLEIPGLTAVPFPLGSQIAKLDLVLSVWQEADGFAGELEYSTDLFDGGTAERLLARFRTLLEAGTGDPEQPVVDLPLLAPEERRQMLLDESKPQLPPLLAGEAVHERFEAMARAWPDAPAVICADGDAWSYRRLDEASNRLARRLRALGAGPEVAVGTAMERSPELIVGLLAILKAGAVYVPLDPAHPDERLDFMRADAGAGLVLVHGRTRERMEGRARLLDAVQETGDGSPLGVRIPAESLAYVIYTSGSTGTPKGVGVAHRAVAAHCATIVQEYGLGPGQRMLQFASLGFDASLEQMLATLGSGTTLVLRGEDLLIPGALLPGLARLGITVGNFPTAFWQQTLPEWSGAADLGPLPLRLLMIGGEAMLPEAARRWTALAEPAGLGGVRLLNGYGPTETVITATRFEVPRSGPLGVSSVLLGRPLPFRTAWVVDSGGHLQPVGVPGELWLGGILARGYLRRPDLTAERFVPDPFGSEPGARLYRSGDLVRRVPGGDLEYFGRIDRQVKVRGFRIEPGEVEAVLGSHPAVQECMVLARESVLVAYVVLDRFDATDPRSLLSAWLRERLPDYMVPGAIVFLDALPLTPNGKVDRKALPAPERTGSAEGEGAAPSDPVEELLAGIWAEILGRDRVGVHDSFFALGGHSLLAAQVVSRIRAVLGVELPLRKLFECNTVASLARAVKAARQESGAQAPPIARRPADSLPPLSFAQQRIWFVERLNPGTAVFNVPSLYALSGLLEVTDLGQALAAIVRRHEALRTTIAGPAGSPFQLVHPVHPGGAPDLPVVDLSALPAEPRAREADRVVEREARRPLDPVRGPLARFLLLRSEADDHRLLAVFHHLISDGVSQEIFARELVALHGALTAGRPFPLADLPVQYADYAAWQRQLLTGAHLAAQVAFWRERLAGPLPVLRLPTDRPRPEVPSSRGALVQTTLPAALTAAVRELSRREGSTLYITLLAAFLALLHRATGQRDLPLGTPVSYRDRPEIEGLIGMFVNTLVIRAEVAPDAGFRAHLAHVRERVLEAFGHQDVPFERLVEELRPERGPHDTPFFQLMFGFYTRPEVSLRAGGLEMHPRDLDNGTAQFELTFYLVDTRSDLVAEVEYRTELFDPATIDRMIAAFQGILEAAVAAPDLPIAELPFQEWLAALPPPAAAAEPPPARLAAVEAVAARAAQLDEKRSLLTEEQRERMRQRLRPK